MEGIKKENRGSSRRRAEVEGGVKGRTEKGRNEGERRGKVVGEAARSRLLLVN